ncbi:heme lyase NrfEFG subunit NrfF, partial [Vibrio parahaemolyticus]|nr:heme lyase NrfEFG subunit NrfF [Vibrio parahaemolyticus]
MALFKYIFITIFALALYSPVSNGSEIKQNVDLFEFQSV